MRIVRIIAFFGALGLLLFASGVHDYMVVARNPQPIEMSLHDYLNSGSDAEWVHLTNCQVDYPRAVCLINREKHLVSDISAPVYTASAGGPVHVVLAVKGTYPTNLFDTGIQAQTQTINGLVRSGFSLNSQLWPFFGLDSRLRKAAKWEVDDHYIVIDEDAKPDGTWALVKTGGGIILLTIGIWLMMRGLNTGDRRMAQPPPLPVHGATPQAYSA